MVCVKLQMVMMIKRESLVTVHSSKSHNDNDMVMMVILMVVMAVMLAVVVTVIVAVVIEMVVVVI